MVVGPVMQWVFTIVFAGLALHSLMRLSGSLDQPVQMIGHLTHAVMSADMAAMAWPWWSAIPYVPELVFFSAATAWFVALLVFEAVRSLRARGTARTVWHRAMHAVMMLTMVWMVAAMGGGEHASGHHHHGTLSAASALSGAGLVGALVVAGALLVVELVAAAGPWSGGRTQHRLDLASHAAMCFGMAAMGWLMLAH